MTATPTLAARLAAHSTLRVLRLDLAGATLPDRLRPEWQERARLIDKAIYADSFPHSYDPGVVEAGRALMIALHLVTSTDDVEDHLRNMATALAYTTGGEGFR